MKALYFALGLRVIGAAVFLLNTEMFQQCLLAVLPRLRLSA